MIFNANKLRPKDFKNFSKSVKWNPRPDCMNDFPLTVSKYVQDIWRVEILNLCPILFLNKGAHRHGNIDLYIMGIYNSEKEKCGFKPKTILFFPKNRFYEKLMYLSRKQNRKKYQKIPGL